MDYPSMITNLPRADIAFNGVAGWLLQGADIQAVFLEIEPIGEVKPHSHSAQFGFVLEGEMSLTIGGNTRRYKRGDTYFIPENVVHSAVFHSHFKAVDIFNEKQRYQARTQP